jgi:DNA-binding transcriptional ArsR family regulator
MQAGKKKLMSDAQIEEAARQFAVLSEPSRLKLLRALMSKAMTVSELTAATEMKQGNVSKHLGMLLNTRFVAKEKEGNFARYFIADPKLFALCELMCGRMEREARQRLARLSGSALSHALKPK